MQQAFGAKSDNEEKRKKIDENISDASTKIDTRESCIKLGFYSFVSPLAKGFFQSLAPFSSTCCFLSLFIFGGLH